MASLTAAWSNGFHGPVSAGVMLTEMLRLQRRHKVITPHMIVEIARPEAAPLHRAFTWDDATAGEKWRLHEARQLTCHLRILNEQGRPERAYFNVQVPDKAQGYVDKVTLLSDDELRDYWLQAALRDLRATRERYHEIADLAAVWQAISLFDTPAA